MIKRDIQSSTRIISALSILFGIFLFLSVSCVGLGEALNVTVSILPQKFFVEKIGGDRVKVEVMVPSGAYPASYEPKPAQMVSLKRAKLYFSIGVPFEKAWLPRFRSANPGLRVVDTSEDIETIFMKSRHFHRGEKSPHSQNDPHIWLSPPLVKKQAKTIMEALVKLDPTAKDLYEKNYLGFVDEIEKLDKYLKQLFEGKKGARFLVFHPSWGYFARAYGLEQISMEIEGKNPGPMDVERLIRIAREQKIRAVFVQPQVSARSASVIAKAIDGSLVFVDPLAENWEQNLKQVAEKFKAALR